MAPGGPSLGLAVGRALLIAGPPAVGKSTLMRSMRSGMGTAVLPSDLREVSPWVFSTLTGFRELGRIHAGHVPNLALHVDFSQLAMPRGHRIPRLRTLLSATQEIHVLTLWAPPQVLLQRLDTRQHQRSGRDDTALDRLLDRTRATERPRAAAREQMKRDLFADPRSLDRLYEQWAAFLAELPITSSRLVDSSTPGLSVISSGLGAAVGGTSTAPRTEAHGAGQLAEA